jgi:hypothetical protein
MQQEESTTPDVLELTRRWVDAWNRKGVDAGDFFNCASHSPGSTTAAGS